MTPEELQAELQKQEQAKIAANAALEKQIAAGLERQKQPFVDLTPTAAFLDSLYGSKLTPASAQLAENRLKEETLLNDLLGKKTEAQAKAALANAQNRDAYKQDRQQARFDQSQQEAFERNLQTDFDKNIAIPAETKAKQFADIESAIASNDYRSVTAMLPQIARGLGQTGVLTDRDVALVFPQTVATKLSDIESYLSGSATPPPQLKQYLKALVTRGRENFANQLRDQSKRKIETYKDRKVAKNYGIFDAGGFGKTIEETTNQTIQGLRGMPQEQAPGGMTDAQRARLAELKAKKAAGKI